MTQGSEQSGEKESPDGQRAQIEKARSAGTTDFETIVESLRVKLAESKKALNALSAQVAEGEQGNAELTAQLAEKERKISSLSAQLAHSELELERITGTLGWRLLRLYGRIKYRYLLPLYRLLGSATLWRLAGPKWFRPHTGETTRRHNFGVTILILAFPS